MHNQSHVTVTNKNSAMSVPLYVDLDGTLIKCDLLIESFVLMLKQNPLLIIYLPIWLLKGKAYLKCQIATRVSINPSLLPYNPEFLDYLKVEAASGRQLILATASNKRLAQCVADYLGIFQDVLASDETVNLSGQKKLQAMLEQCGEGKFDYAANAKVDLSIWLHARNSVLVNPERGVSAEVRKITNVKSVFDQRKSGLTLYLRAIRIHQWLKNLLLFVPLLTSHQWSNLGLITNLILGFFAFSFCASSGYLLNDLLDLNADRLHPRKRTRPFASGDIPLLHGGILMFLLLFSGIGLAAVVSISLLEVLLLYLVITMTYSLYFKQIVLIDVLTLAGLYTLRVIAGAVAIDVILSFWLLAFSIFIFLSLALVKRCAELRTLVETDQMVTTGRDYRVSDLDYLRSMGTASGYLSVLVLALFINSADVTQRYTHPQVLWLMCPIILFWISHVWIKAGRGEMDDDPLIFSIKDKSSRYVLIAAVFVVLLAI